ncbi:MAG: hypothetical protein FJ038_05525 [Chloroflexi bacterium]|nr:hypothetical protein [Chloroflexota bacterium]
MSEELGGAASPEGADPGIGLVAARPLIHTAPSIWFPLRPGDRPMIEAGETVLAGAPLAELLHEQQLVEAALPRGAARRTGAQWTDRTAGSWRFGGRRSNAPIQGELLFKSGGRWRLATGDSSGILESPMAGIVREVRPGVGIRLDVEGNGLAGVRAIGAPARGRLEVAPSTDDARPPGLDVGRAGSILVVASRVDAETLTRARAMGIRGIVVSALTAKDVRDFLASEERQRASLHRVPPFAVLVVDGAIRRPVATPLLAVLSALVGRDVAISGDPPLLLFDPGGISVPVPAPDWVRVRQGPWGGREGHWVAPAGIRRFPGGVRLEAGLVRFGDGRPIAVPLSDLERYV